MRVAVVINPVAGVRGTLERARRRAERAATLLVRGGAEPDILITERGGHAHELARNAIERGARIVVAWGGDGTVNEVASALAFSPVALGVIPAGSGNGLARMFGLPSDPVAAISRLLHGSDRPIDLGQMNGRLFANVAGIGFDAHVAARFAALHRSRRGFLRYAAIVLGELGRYRSARYALTLDGASPVDRTAFLLTFANGRQWGNGAVIAPGARPDDGLLDVVVVSAKNGAQVFRSVPRLFLGSVDRARGVETTRVTSAHVTSDSPLMGHVDGEPCPVGNMVEVRVHPAGLRLRL